MKPWRRHFIKGFLCYEGRLSVLKMDLIFVRDDGECLKGHCHRDFPFCLVRKLVRNQRNYKCWNESSLRKQPTTFEVATVEPSLNDDWVTTQILVVLLIGSNEIPRVPTNQKYNQDLDNDTLSVWNFCARYSDVVLWGLKWRPRETSAVFSS